MLRARFGAFWRSLDRGWLGLAHLGEVWTRLAQLGEVWVHLGPILVQIGLNLAHILAHMGPNLT